jgi:competence ComEA-like helix-hairpin-helix protein
VTVALSTLKGRDRQRLLVLWAWIAVLHGLLIGAQFFSTDVWRFSSGLGGKAVVFQVYRPAGLFISQYAGDANAAALFQLIGFVPLVLARPSKRVGGVAGGVLLCSIVATGSMGATLALLSGLVISAIAGAVLVRRFGLALARWVPVAAVLGSLVYIVMALNPDYQAHFERIFFGRADRSSEGRLDLWQRGIGVLVDRNTYLWGVGPENFREVDGRDKQLHNDLLAFVVERGVLGGLGLMLFAGTALGKAVQLVRLYAQSTRPPRLETVVFPAAMVGLVVESLTHQIFHAREMWLLLAVQEAMLLRWRGLVLSSGLVLVAKPVPAGKVDINAASVEQLETLPGVGAKLAARIVEYRQRSGGFRSTRELMNVKGIGEKNFAKIETYLTLGDAVAKAGASG